ncbi:MAG: hypothetical protein ACPKQO_10655 [Nitrososphaeraceae archaeon]
MAFLMDLSAIVSFVNIILLIVLLTIYIRIYSASRAQFTIGLIFFASMLIVHNAIGLYAYFSMASLYADDLLPYFLMVHIAELAGIAAMLKITI